MKIKLQKYYLGQPLLRFKISTSRLCTYGIIFILFLVQMSQRISAKGKNPSMGPIFIQINQSFPLPFLSNHSQKLNLMKRLIQNMSFIAL